MNNPQYLSGFPRPGAAVQGPASWRRSGDNPLGLIAMICGLLSLIMGCPLSIAAIILGFCGLKKEPKGMATAGLILGIVTLTLNVLLGCFFLAFYGLTIGTEAAVATIAPAFETTKVLRQEAAKIEISKEANGLYPDEGTGTSLVSGSKDGWGNQIVYRLEGTDYVLVSPGADGFLDTDDDVPLRAAEYVPEASAPSEGLTERALGEAIEIIDDHHLTSTSDYFPADAEGQRLIDHLADEWGNKLVYRQTEGGEWYLVIAKGRDGILGTADDYDTETEAFSE